MKCEFDQTKTPPLIQIDGYRKLNSNNQDEVMKHLATEGPLLINVDASNWHLYESGIYDGCDYEKNMDVDHVV